MAILVEQTLNEIQSAGGINTNKPMVIGTTTTPPTFSFNGTSLKLNILAEVMGPVAANSTATLTPAQVIAGYITSTSGSATTLTMPTGTLLGNAVGATKGTIMELYVDNTAGANTVTMAVAVNGILSDAAATTAASFGQLTVASGVTGVGRFTVMFSSPTAYVFTRTA